MPFFSIIIPTYNSAECLKKSIDSITSQTFGDYEIIFVDGLSKDNTIQLIACAKKTYPGKIRYISEPDKGIYDAMNKSIPLASGDWIYFMGSDDQLYSPDVLQNIYTEIQKESVDLIYGNVTGEGSLKHYVHDSVSTILSTGIHHQSIFYKRQVFKTVGNYNPFFKVSADYLLTLKIFCNPQFKTKYVNQEIARFGEGGLSSRTFDYTLLSYHYKFLAQHNALSRIDDPGKCLDTSIYCSFYIARQKKNVAFAWKNILYYVFSANPLDLKFRIKTFLRMLQWTLKSA
jgi:glycosyltransferase involved in cell wall biosynthesis